jgi:uncharacterized protein (TIGR02145 family)
MKGYFALILISIFLMLLSCNFDDDTYVDTRDGRSYKTVKIEDQIWMAENLNTDRFQNGDLIPQAATDEEWRYAANNKEPAWCYYNNDTINKEKYGKLYNWYAVNDPRGLAQAGWRLPSILEWKKSLDYFDKKRQDLEQKSSYDALKAEEDLFEKWKYLSDCVEKKISIGNSEFSITHAGCRFYDGRFLVGGSVGYWWSATEIDMKYAACLWIDNEKVIICPTGIKSYGLSVRCIKD